MDVDKIKIEPLQHFLLNNFSENNFQNTLRDRRYEILKKLCLRCVPFGNQSINFLPILFGKKFKLFTSHGRLNYLSLFRA